MEHIAVLVDEMMSLGSNLMDVNVALIKVHNHWLLSSDGESEMLQSCVIVIIRSPFCYSYFDQSCWSVGDWMC
ncbi:hypothetical protein Syun_012134 [Stephania yunnanensis]|uniref:Uncharacterized protein n=1 Tax=Stephania yunnanensis TaxID=152371 RepID=A0AAP0PH87_9MAGN